MNGFMKGFVRFLLMVAFIVGLVLITVSFVPMPNGKYIYSETNPESKIYNLRPDGKNMVYAGIGLVVGGFVGFMVI